MAYFDYTPVNPYSNSTGVTWSVVRFSIGQEKPVTWRAFLEQEYTEDKEVTLTKLSSGRRLWRRC